MRKRKYSFKGLKVEFHRTYLLLALGFVLTGHYLNLIIFTSLIFVHEIGHYIMALLNKFRVLKIVIYPYGGITKIDDMVNRDICEEILIASSGVIIQYFFYLIIAYFYQRGIIREYTYNLYTLYSNQMIFFNLLPIYPLDGGRIVNLLLSKFFSFNFANMLTIWSSFFIILMIIVCSIYRCSYSNIMIMGLLLTYLYKFFINRKYLYQRFLIERYLYNIRYSKIKIVKNIKGMFKNKSHLFFINDKYMEERKVLANFFLKRDN